MAAIWRTASARSGSRSFMSGLLGGHPRRCPLRGRAPSGGVIDAVVSASVHYIRRERGRCLTRGRRFRAGVNKLGKTEPETGRRGAEREWNPAGLGGPTVVGSNRETNGDRKFFERLRRRAGRCRQPTGTQMSGGKGFGSPNGTRTYDLLVDGGETSENPSLRAHNKKAPPRPKPGGRVGAT